MRRLRQITRPGGALRLFAAVTGIFIAAVAVGFALPIYDLVSHEEQPQSISAEARAGREIYEVEGCVYCHTQQVRPVSNDLGLGPVARGEKRTGQNPSLLGMSRLGPDLSCVADRGGRTLSEDFVLNPNSVHPSSRMPSFGHLTSREVTNLVEYLKTLTCGGSS